MWVHTRDSIYGNKPNQIRPKLLEGHPHKMFEAWPTLHGWQVSGVTNNLNMHYVKDILSLCSNGCVIFRQRDATFGGRYILQQPIHQNINQLLNTVCHLSVLFLVGFVALLSFYTSYNKMYWKSDSPCYWLCRKVDIQMKQFALHRIPSSQHSVQQSYKNNTTTWETAMANSPLIPTCLKLNCLPFKCRSVALP